MSTLQRKLKWLSTITLMSGFIQQAAHADSLDHIRHVIFNDSAAGAYYDLHAIDNNFCQAKGYLSPGEMKVLSCQSPTVSSYGPYLLQVTPEGWWGSNLRDSKIYNIHADAQLNWRLAYVFTDRGNILGITVKEEPI